MPTTEQEFKAVKNEITEIKDLLSGLQSSKLKKLLDKHEIEDMAQEAGKSVGYYFTRKRKQLIDAKETCEETIRDHPITSAAAAVAGGMVIGSLLRRK